MEERIFYFDHPGKENTEKVIQLSLERAEARGIRKVVFASTTGYTARMFLDSVKDKNIQIIAVPWQFNVREKGSRFPDDLIKKFQEKKHIVHFSTMLLSPGLAQLYGTNAPVVLANILRILGQGMKVCVEIVMMACDGGHIEMGEKVVAVSGTHNGADYSVVAIAAPSSKVTELKIHEIICKPIESN